MRRAAFVGFMQCAVAAVAVLGAPLGDQSVAATPTPVEFNHQDEILRGRGFMVLADRRIFALMAFLNAVGFDDEAPGQSLHPIRTRVRVMVSANLKEHATELDSWRAYYRARRLQVFHYQDWALSLSADYPFRRIRPDRELTYAVTASRLAAFPAILNEFWKLARLDEVWTAVKPDYLAELRKYNFQTMEEQIAHLWRYLRMKRQDTYTIVNVFDPLNRHFQAIGADYENYYYAVESAGAVSYELNVHEYLHSVVNPLSRAAYKRKEGLLKAYFEAGRDGELVKSYQDLDVFVAECLVRTLDARLRVLFRPDAVRAGSVESRVEEVSRQGLTLVAPFYVLLQQYEISSEPFDAFLPKLFDVVPSYRAR